MKKSTIALSQNLQAIAQGLDEVIEETAGERLGFTLLVFTEGRASYISNCSREESVRELKNLLHLWEQGMPDIPAHNYNG